MMISIGGGDLASASGRRNFAFVFVEMRLQPAKASAATGEAAGPALLQTEVAGTLDSAGRPSVQFETIAPLLVLVPQTVRMSSYTPAIRSREQQHTPVGHQSVTARAHHETVNTALAVRLAAGTGTPSVPLPRDTRSSQRETQIMGVALCWRRAYRLSARELQPAHLADQEAEGNQGSEGPAK